MDATLTQIVIGSYGGLLLVIVSFLIKLLYDMSAKQNDTDKHLSEATYVIREISGEKIPTIRIQIEKLDKRADKIEQRTGHIEQRQEQLEASIRYKDTH